MQTPEYFAETEEDEKFMIYRQKSFQVSYDLEKQHESRPSVRDKNKLSPNVLMKIQTYTDLD